MGRLRFLFVIPILANFTLVGLRLADVAPKITEWGFTAAGRNTTLLLAALSMLGAVALLIDACMRRYSQWREVAIAMAVVGLLTCGLTSLVYFAIWGWREATPRFASTFCRKCEEESWPYDRQLDLTTINFVHGGHLVGNSRRCPDCGSVIKSHCFYLAGLPLWSHGSFRVVCPATNEYRVRQRSFYWPHLVHLTILPAIIAIIAVLLLLNE